MNEISIINKSTLLGREINIYGHPTNRCSSQKM